MTRKRRRIMPQPPMDRWAHPTGSRPLWIGLALVGLGVAALAWGPWRTHDVFGDDSVRMAEWKLTKAVTVGGPRRPAPPSQLDSAIADFLGDQAEDLDAGRSDASAEMPDDFCPT